MTLPSFDTLNVGDAIPVLTTAPISRTTLALYCGASADHNPLHVDSDFAKKAGLPDVIAHGMLSMAYLGRALTNVVPLEKVRSFGVRFSAMTQVNDVVTCSGRVIEKFEVDGEKRLRLDIQTTTQTGAITLQGEAVLAF
jgi:acyl dehydratase